MKWSCRLECAGKTPHQRNVKFFGTSSTQIRC
ncbi:MAG: hypothetical protein HOH02_04445 [Oceanospirillaceae bacterium]|nr:hypothetical protein [Oceanospirillaceae bacterium]MBT4441979.1 hypothetical protein [Oceanospirillaceae bacterium]MBT6077194.1 hypothetical protein [Oceanospirillaceae bacterium]